MRVLNLLTFVCASSAYIFKPENSSYKNYDVTVGSSSYWVTSFITGKDQKQYLAVSHILTTEMPSMVCRASVLDLESLEYWVDLQYCSRGNGTLDRSGPLNIDYGSYGFGSTSDDKVSSMYAYANTNKSFSLDLEWESSSKVLLNAGSGVIGFGHWPSNATEWGIPAGKTKGSLVLNGKNIEVDPKNSLTWYDRQISYGVPKNWTWFEVHFNGSPIKASIWAIEEADHRYEFATVRNGESLEVLAYTLEADTSNSWTSTKSNITYPLSWKLKFENGDYLKIDSVRPDQEMYGSQNLVDSAYEGFVKISGKFQGLKKGFGVVEMVTVYNS
ncbi:hypothetical protein G7Z17_g8247 [Cylindrodendrum hubeiense]|uniref:AttH domain-containing protein n=1 Tax=Cylindrodendrum hubeiense TaxID=595255 RepID=A0A9P5H2B7_9HYPO|nr:hypothetical protein G7Z17_g8247 [Cylindrodendrum hubeiense]